MKCLEGKNIVVFDCEIVNDVDGVNVTWATKHLMGLSVGCLFDYRTGDWNVYFQEDIQRMADRITDADLSVGFNINDFDIPLIATNGASFGPDLNTYDMLLESRKAMGWDFGKRYPSGMKLDDHLKATFGPEFVKTENGALAPKMWRDGRRGEIVSYCLADVRREKMLFEYIVKYGNARTAAHGERKFDLTKINKVLGI